MRNGPELYYDLTCPHCGTVMKVKADQTQILCDYCGMEIQVETMDPGEWETEEMFPEEKPAKKKGKKEPEVKARELVEIAGYVVLMVLLGLAMAYSK